MARLPYLEPDQVAPEYRDMLKRNTNLHKLLVNSPDMAKSFNGVGNFTENDFGWDLGAGVMGYFSNNVGLRFDYRYFRNFQETNTNVVGLEVGHFAFNRASVGVLFRF